MYIKLQMKESMQVLDSTLYKGFLDSYACAEAPLRVQTPYPVPCSPFLIWKGCTQFKCYVYPFYSVQFILSEKQRILNQCASRNHIQTCLHFGLKGVLCNTCVQCLVKETLHHISLSVTAAISQFMSM
jgi:hypothetical protein